MGLLLYLFIYISVPLSARTLYLSFCCDGLLEVIGNRTTDLFLELFRVPANSCIVLSALSIDKSNFPRLCHNDQFYSSFGFPFIPRSHAGFSIYVSDGACRLVRLENSSSSTCL